tara:strand:+ start:59 stop:337 length:279 start_codon:yes stop_codon:yes gene_type:complete
VTNTPLSFDPVQHPKHYKLRVNGQPIEAWDLLDSLFGRNPTLWNAAKYLFRVGSGGKDNDLQDLKKCRQFLSREIDRLEHLENAVNVTAVKK